MIQACQKPTYIVHKLYTLCVLCPIRLQIRSNIPLHIPDCPVRWCKDCVNQAISPPREGRWQIGCGHCCDPCTNSWLISTRFMWSVMSRKGSKSGLAMAAAATTVLSPLHHIRTVEISVSETTSTSPLNNVCPGEVYTKVYIPHRGGEEGIYILVSSTLPLFYPWHHSREEINQALTLLFLLQV